MAKLIDVSSGRILLEDLQIATTPRQRLRGLLGRTHIAETEGMFFPHCRAVHTFFMKITIDVVFTDNNGYVLDCIENLPPWRIAFCHRPGKAHTLELAQGAVKKLALGRGQQISIVR